MHACLQIFVGLTKSAKQTLNKTEILQNSDLEWGEVTLQWESWEGNRGMPSEKAVFDANNFLLTSTQFQNKAM